MKNKSLNRYIIAAMVLLLLLSAALKVSGGGYEIQVKNWNAREIGKIKTEYGSIEGGNFSFAVLGDNKNSKRIFQDLLKRIDGEDVIFALDTGDTVMKGEPVYFSSFLKQIESSTTPILTVPGNHEMYGTGREYYSQIFGPYYYSFSLGNSYFIVLDDSNEEYVNETQMQWLEKELQKGQEYRYRFVAMHVPLFDPRFSEEKQPGHSLGNVTNARELNALFDAYNVTLVLCGHIHGYFHGTWGKTPYIITGGAGGEIIGGIDKEHYFYHYVVVNVSSKGVSYSVVKLPVDDSYAYRLAYGIALHIGIFLKANILNALMLISGAYLIYLATIHIFPVARNKLKK